MIKWDHTPNHLYNFYDQENYEAKKSFVIAPIVRTSQGHTKVNLPPEFCIESTDRIGFYIEYADEYKKHVHRICRVFTEAQYKALTPQERNLYNIRKVRPMAGKRFNAIVPVKAIKTPQPTKQWTNIVFHYSNDPNLYYMEFKDLSKVPKPEKVPVQEQESEITYAQNPFDTPGIRWD